MITCSQKLIDITQDKSIIDELQTTGNALKDLLTSFNVSMVNAVVYNVPVTVIYDNHKEAIRLLSGNLIVDIPCLNLTIDSNLPIPPLADYNILNLAALLMTVKHMKLTEEKESL